MIPCVVLEEDGDTEALRLGKRLNRVGELRHLTRRDDEAVTARRHAAIAGIGGRLDDVPQDEASHLLRLDQARAGGRQRPAASRPHRVDQHEPGLLVERHARDQVVDADVDREPPVLVPVDRPIAVGVPELLAIDGQHRARSHADDWLRRKVGGSIPARPSS